MSLHLLKTHAYRATQSEPQGTTHATGLALSFFEFSLKLTFDLPSRYKSPAFAEQLFNVIHDLHLYSWRNSDITPQALKIQKVSGSLTNAVFFVSCPSVPLVPTLLLRIYGPSSGSLINRSRELHVLHALSSRYHIGPKVYGTFENGRVEEYFESTTLTAHDLRDPKISSWIGARMAELHQVDIATVELQSPPASPTFGERSDVIWPVAAVKNVKSWLVAAQEVLSLDTVSDEIRTSVDLDQFKLEWNQYIRWLGKTEKEQGSSPIVFAHNDAQYGNLLRLANVKEDYAEHRQVNRSPVSFPCDQHILPHILSASRRSSLSTLNTPLPIPRGTILRTTSTSGPPTTILTSLTFSILNAIPLSKSGRTSIAPT